MLINYTFLFTIPLRLKTLNLTIVINKGFHRGNKPTRLTSTEIGEIGPYFKAPRAEFSAKLGDLVVLLT